MKVKIKAFILGLKEFRSNITTHFESPEIEYYDLGRDLAHIFTFGRFEV
jgi:hypothetical protein